MIGGRLALNDTGFILVQATCPTSSLSRSVTLFLSPDAQSLQWGYKREGERWGVQEVRSALVGRAESDRNSATSLVFKRALEVQTWQFYGCGLVNLVDLMNLKGLSLNQPGLTRYIWRERIRFYR